MWQQLRRKVGLRDREWGDWHTPDDLDAPRYRTIADLVKAHADGVPLLDLGCGTAPLLKHLPPDQPYLGIDCQQDALDRAVCGPNQRVRVGDIGTPPTDVPFGCAVFSEVLYYQPTTKAAMALIQTYARVIQAPRIAIVSIWISRTKHLPKNGGVFDALKAQYVRETIATEWVEASGGGWHLFVLHL